MSRAQAIFAAAKRRTLPPAIADLAVLNSPTTVSAFTRIGSHVTLAVITGSHRKVKMAAGGGGDAELIPLQHSVFAGSLLICRHGSVNTISLQVDGNEITLDISNGQPFDPRSFAERFLAPLALTDRQKACEKISTAVFTMPEPDLSAYRPLMAIREVLATPLTPPANTEGLHFSGHVDFFGQVDGRTVYLRGWLLHADGPIEQLKLISPDGQSVDITGSIFIYRRTDIERTFDQPAFDGKRFGYGFIACVTLPHACPVAFGWKLYLRDTAGNQCEQLIEPGSADLAEIRREILGDVRHQPLEDDSLLEKQLHPALEALQARHRSELGVAMVRQFGEQPANPIASIIVPLYGRYDFVVYQMALFANDPDMRQAELIYVLDSPELSLGVLHFAIEVYEIYRIPFKIIFLKHNAGYSHANNIGASFATAPILLLLNSDVLPAAPGWLKKMVKFYQQTPQIGVLGPKLLYEDETLQHAGMYFGRNDTEQVWINKHYYKGLSRNLPEATKNRIVPAVTGAAMMISRELFNGVGGLSGEFVHGDFEDSDLCLRLTEKGLEHWYLADVELFHLEGQSYPSEVRINASRFNRWLHSRIWGEKIGELMKRAEFADIPEIIN